LGRLDLSGKPIAITGASSGIGAATAIACARAGMPVVLGARRTDRLADLAATINAAARANPALGRAVAVRADVTSPDDCAALVDRTVAEFGSIYAIYANAGYGIELPVHRTPDADLRAIFETNFFGTLNTIRPALPHMLRAGRGHVLICSSCLAKLPLPWNGAYTATKAAQSHIGRAMHYELAPAGIHVSTVHPIGTRTEMFEQIKVRHGRRELVAHTPDRFMQPPERVADATVRCLRRPRIEVWTSAFVRLGMAVCNAFPGAEGFHLHTMVRTLDRSSEPDPAGDEAPRPTP
jgi:NAD(P)-dependent dehydrogenase (short-subunit alcohol dehydrogenase family)